MADLKTRSAVERQLQIVTEAVYRLGRDVESHYPGPDWTEWKGMGNLLRHAYHRLNSQIIWGTITDDLPELKQDVTAALQKLNAAQ